MSTKAAGKANLDCSFSGPTKGEAVKDFEIINNHDNTHTVKYTPVQQVRETHTCRLLGPRTHELLTLTLLHMSRCDHVHFLPQGPLGVAVTYGGDPIPKSPFSVAVAPTLDLGKINVTGLGDSASLSCPLSS